MDKSDLSYCRKNFAMRQRRFFLLLLAGAIFLYLLCVTLRTKRTVKVEHVPAWSAAAVYRQTASRTAWPRGKVKDKKRRANRILFREGGGDGEHGDSSMHGDETGVAKLMATRNALITWLVGYDPNKRASPYIFTSKDVEECIQSKELANARKPSRKSAKLIFYWQEDAYMPPKSGGFRSMCRRPLARPCEITFDQSLYAEADAIVFHASRISSEKPPFEKRPGQIWIARGLESPAHWRKGYKSPGWRGVFNWTMTYRPDSEVFSSVGTLFRRPYPPAQDYRKIALGKARSVAWFVSDCETLSNREAYVEEMKKYIDVDIYGECGDMTCPKHGSDCYRMLSQKYRYYLSFENSYCPFYVTEKFYTKFGGLDSPWYVIPIVRGGFDYRKYFPDATYINADDFRSAKELAGYLNKLSDDVDAYAALLERKAHFGASACIRKEDWCQLCDLLHDPHQPVNLYGDLAAWWDTQACQPAPEIVT